MELMARKSKSRVLWSVAGLVLAALAISGCAFSPEAREARFLDAGKKALAKKDYGRAIIQFTNAVRAKKSDPEAYYQLGLAYVGRGDGDMALKAFWQAAELNPKHAAAQVKIAELLNTTREKRFLENSERRLADVLQASPDNMDALIALGNTEWELGKPGDAEQHLQRALAKFPNELNAAVALATLRLRENDLKSTEEILRKVASQQPPAANAIVALAEFYSYSNRFAEAQHELERAVQLDPTNSLALYDLGNLLRRAGKTDQAETVYNQLSHLPDRRYKPVHAIFLFNSGKTQQALTEFEQLYNQDPKDRTARSMLVEAYWKAGRTADAQQLLGKALKANSRDSEALLQRSAIFLAVGKLAEVQADLQQVLRLQPDSAQAHYLMSRVHLALHAPLSRRQELAEAVRLNENFLQARTELAHALIVAKGAKAALDLMNQASKQQQKTVPAIIELNWARMATGDIAGMRQGVKDGLGQARVPDLLLQDGILKIQEQNISAARASLEEALDKNPDDVRALDLIVLTFYYQNQQAAVAPKLREYAQKYPKSAAIPTRFGEWLLASGDRKQALSVLAAADASNPKYLPAKMAHARAETAMGNLKEAQKILSTLMDSNRQFTPAGLLLGDVDALSGDRSTALQHYTKVLETDPSNVLALNNTAFLLADFANKPDEALKYAERAKELAPSNPEIEDTLGWVLYHKGVYDVALRHLIASVAAGSTPQRQYHLAMTYFKLGNRKKGQEVLQAALRQDPSLPEARLALEVQAQLVASRKP